MKCRDTTLGGSDGAIAVALTFAMLFLDRGTTRNLLEVNPDDVADPAPKAPRPVAATADGRPEEGTRCETTAELDALPAKVHGLERDQALTRNAFKAHIDQQSRQKWPLAMASVFGTLAWGFGD